MLRIENLHATVAGKPILKGLSLAVNAGEDGNCSGSAWRAPADFLLRHSREGGNPDGLYARSNARWIPAFAAGMRTDNRLPGSGVNYVNGDGSC